MPSVLSKSSTIAGALLLLVVAGCAPLPRYPAPTAQRITTVRTIVANAEQKVPPGDEAAMAHIRNARQQLVDSDAAMRAGDTDHASLLLVRAETDAELALVVASSAGISAEAQAAEEELRQLQSAGTGTAAPAGGATTTTGSAQ